MATYRAESDRVELRGTFLKGRRHDLPTLIWFSDLVEPAANFKPFFEHPDNKVLNVRNVWLLDIRNMGESDHHDSFDMHDISSDISRFMDKQKLTMATLGGHGFGAKVALAAAIDNMDRCTGVINLEGGPLDHKYYEAYQELNSYVDVAAKVDLSWEYSTALKYLETNISCPKWKSIFL